jgi:hypothetical protein
MAVYVDDARKAYFRGKRGHARLAELDCLPHWTGHNSASPPTSFASKRLYVSPARCRSGTL